MVNQNLYHLLRSGGEEGEVAVSCKPHGHKKFKETSDYNHRLRNYLGVTMAIKIH